MFQVHRILEHNIRHRFTRRIVQVRSMAYTYEWPRPGLTVDALIVAKPTDARPPQCLLISRKHAPCKDKWALPGGFVEQNEPLDKAAARELQEETSVDPSSVLLQQFGAFGDPGRDPRGWCVTAAYVALVPTTDLGVKAADDAKDAQWFVVDDLPELAFDHQVIIRKGFLHLAKQEEAGSFASQLLDAAAKLDRPWIPPTE